MQFGQANVRRPVPFEKGKQTEREIPNNNPRGLGDRRERGEDMGNALIVQEPRDEEAEIAEAIERADLQKVARALDGIDTIRGRRRVSAKRKEGDRADQDAVAGF